jgi:biopolymer transport protein ExbD
MTSMPDLIFTVLFFFMIVTHMRKETPVINPDIPTGTELTKPANNRLISNLYIGQDKTGETVIQFDDKVVTLETLGATAAKRLAGLNEDDASVFTINIRADKNTPMGIIADVKQELRKAGTLNIRYNGTEK